MRSLVAMSGGVDSAVAAFLVKEQGHDLVGANMRFWEYNVACNTLNTKSSCCSPEDLADAEKSAASIGIPFYAIKMEKDFRGAVIEPFIQDYQNGRTPNPCVHCNTFIKFGEFYDKAKALGYEKIVTGHYANITQLESGRYAVSPAVDDHKDQSYYLYGLSQEALAQTLFPLAGLTKKEVRSIAEENNLVVAKKPESQEICFIPDNDYRKFLAREGVAFTPGFFRNTAGHIVGKHDGKEKFTIGQRKGLGIALGEPAYVIEILSTGDVILGNRAELDRTRFNLKDIVYQGLELSDLLEMNTVQVQIRYNSKPTPGKVSQDDDGNLVIELDEPASAITAGQSAVLYDPEFGYILCGGKIQTASMFSDHAHRSSSSKPHAEHF